jgi:hypothetical protein
MGADARILSHPQTPMSGTPKEYQRLPGRGLRGEGSRLLAFSRSFCQLWMGGDHLLLVDRTGYTETYKRFYFRDIQAVIIRKTSRATTWNWIMGSFALLFTLSALGVQEFGVRIVFWFFAGFFGLFTLINLLRGPTCVTHIKTAVQTEQLHAWNRLGTARKGMMKLRPHLLQAQGEISADELRVRLEDLLRHKAEGPATGPT